MHPIRDTVAIKVIVSGDTVISVRADAYDAASRLVRVFERMQRDGLSRTDAEIAITREEDNDGA